MKKKAQNNKTAKNFAFAWTDNAWEDYLYWQKEDLKILEEINHLLDECRRHPFTGTGKPEPLKGNLTGYWSRRINKEHRLVYLPEDHGIYVLACRYHY
jgi:toxin YoeB